MIKLHFLHHRIYNEGRMEAFQNESKLLFCNKNKKCFGLRIKKFLLSTKNTLHHKSYHSNPHFLSTSPTPTPTPQLVFPARLSNDPQISAACFKYWYTALSLLRKRQRVHQNKDICHFCLVVLSSQLSGLQNFAVTRKRADVHRSYGQVFQQEKVASAFHHSSHNILTVLLTLYMAEYILLNVSAVF